MPEWSETVKQRLGALGLDPQREAEIVAELADHCQELFDYWRERGLSADEATARALEDVRDWKELGREIQRAELEEETMNPRTRKIWLPGLVTGTLSMALLWSLELLGFHMRIFWHSSNPPGLMFSLPWLLVLPFVGALGAYLSARAGGGPRERLVAGLFPSAALTLLFAAVMPIALLRGSLLPWSFLVSALASALLGWVLIPGAALLVGVLPFLFVGKPRPIAAS